MNYDLYTYHENERDDKSMKFTVIIATYNRCDELKNCLRHMKQQSYKNFECIIVNDFSADDTIRVCEEFIKNDERFKLLNNTRHMGVSESRNAALRVATGDYVAFCDDDDYYRSDKLKYCQSILSKTPHDILWHEMYRVKNGKQQKTTNKKSQLFTLKDRLLLSSFAYDIGHVINKVYRLRFLRDNDLWFDRRLNCFEDLHLNIRAYLKSKEMYYTNEHLYSYVVHGDSAARREPCILDILQWRRVFDELDEQLSTDDDYVKFMKRNVNNFIDKLLTIKRNSLRMNKARHHTFDRKTLISRINCERQRLGNVLFEFFGGYSLAKKYGFDYHVQYLRSEKQKHDLIDGIIEPFVFTYDFNYDIHVNDQRDARLIDDETLDEIFHDNDVIYLSNLLQGECYLNRESTRMYRPTDEMMQHITDTYGDLSDTVAISIRRGDYLLYLDKWFAVPTADWYHEVIETYFKDKKLLISSDDIDWCRENFSRYDDVRFCDEEPETALFTLARCHGGFIGSNSTFSWWAAYLGEDTVDEHEIIFPSRWWSLKCTNQEVLLPDRWTKHDLKNNYEKTEKTT